MAPSATASAPLAESSTKKSGATKRQLLDDSDAESSDAESAGDDAGFKVNEEYARRFEHNKKREEKQKLEEKYKNGKQEDSDDSSSDETEDEEGFLATEDLDVQISATLQAIRNKDPRVYDKASTFYQGGDDDEDTTEKAKKEKPIYLQDYHREKILRGDAGASDDEDEAPQTYNQEQAALKQSIMSEINAANGGKDSVDEDDDEDDDDDDDFMKPKEPVQVDSNGVHPSRAAALKVSEVDVANADKNPENFLSNFMASRAWVADEGLRWKAFESDDEDDDQKADQFEQAYNLRFEDPEKSNEVLKSYSRDITASRSVRREEKSKRRKQREVEKEKAHEEKQQRREEKARLKKLKLEEAEEKLAKIKQAAGATGRELRDSDWVSFLNDAWEDDKWEEEMHKRFGEDYYAIKEDLAKSEDEEEEGGEAAPTSKKRKNPKKPKWDDDIDIKDIVPDFDDEDAQPGITLSDDDDNTAQGEQQGEEDDAEDAPPPSKKRKAADHKRARLDSQKKARQERSKLEALVDSKMELTDHDLLAKPSASSSAAEAAAAAAGFRYREVSPQAFGMTSRDILLAPSDKVLNEFAGLKKLASFRDEQKKRKDKKSIGKKARLRQWRRDNFGSQFERTGPTYGFEMVVDADADEQGAGAGYGEETGKVIEVEDGDGKTKKRKRSKGKGKSKQSEAVEAS